MNQNCLIDYILNMLLNHIPIKYILKKSYGFNVTINNIKKIENNLITTINKHYLCFLN